MARYLIVVDRMEDWRWSMDGLEVRAVDTVLTETPSPVRKRSARLINLCRRYTYLSAGYYCSLLAEARGAVPMPTVADILELTRKGDYAHVLPDLERVLHATLKRLSDPPEAGFDLHVYFGRADDLRFHKLAAEAFDLFRYPLLKVRIVQGRRWRIKWVRPMGLHQVTGALAPFFEETLRAYVRAPRRRAKAPPPSLYDLAILADPSEAMPPSNPKALARFAKVGRALRIDVETIGPRDLHRVPEFDALFIRQTTALDDHTFRFARKAEVEGIPVIDDPASILRCTNKVFLAETLRAKGVPTPNTIALDRENFDEGRMASLEAALGYPMVLKIPDGSFSRGVVKAEKHAQVLDHAAKLFERSRIILAQAYMYTAFDWRIGVLAGKPLFACQYLMSARHWQIYRHRDDGTTAGGGFTTMSVEDAPAVVVETAVRAAALMGDGLYGVDLKETPDGVFVIEVNDNPNIDAGVEDKVLKDELYERVLAEFIRRIEKVRTGL